MPRLIAVRILQAVPVILIVSVLAFLLITLLPGDPAVVIAGDQASPEAIAVVRHNLGLDKPLIEQLGTWFVRLLHGNFGSSLMLNQTVLSAMGERLPVTLSLAALSILITLPVGILAGVIAAYYRQTWVDSFVMTLALLGVSAPAFWIAILSIHFSASICAGFRPVGIRLSFRSGALAALARSSRADAVSLPDWFSCPYDALRDAGGARPGFCANSPRQRP